MRMKKRWLYIPIFAIVLTCLIVGSFKDFAISSAIYDKDNAFYIFMAAFGEYPGYIVLSFLGGHMCAAAYKFYKDSFWAYFFIFVGICAYLCSVYFQGNAITNINGYNIPDQKYSVGVPIAFLMLTPLFIIGLIIGRKCEQKELCLVAFLLLLASSASIGFINIVKVIQHRPRFRWLIASGNEDLFHNWWERFGEYKDYIAQGVNKDQFKSYPSGHVGTASYLVALPYLPLFIRKPKLAKFESLLFLIGVSYSFFLAFTRVRCGAHFITDVSWGCLFSLFLHFIANEIIQRKVLKNEATE